MAVILENRSLGEEMYLLRAQYEGKAEPGQFFMLRSAGAFRCCRDLSASLMFKMTASHFFIKS